MIKEFREFIARGNVIDLAVAVILGAAFGKIVTSLVEGIVMPPLGLILGKVDFANLFIDLSGQHPASLAEAKLKAKCEWQPLGAHLYFLCANTEVDGKHLEKLKRIHGTRTA